MKTMKRKTAKYTIYPNGDVYLRDGKLTAINLTPEECEFLSERKSSEIDDLLDDYPELLHERMKQEAGLGLSIRDAMREAGFDDSKPPCVHRYRDLPSDDSVVIFYCVFCLSLKRLTVTE